MEWLLSLVSGARLQGIADLSRRCAYIVHELRDNGLTGFQTPTTAARGVSESVLRHTEHADSLARRSNRGEIAIRVFRTAHELAMKTVAIYSYEDRMNAHRYKVRRVSLQTQSIADSFGHYAQADESYMVGQGMTPVAAYLAQDDIIRIALEHGVDMIHPG